MTSGGKPKEWTTGRKILAILGGVFGLFLLQVFGWWRNGNADPHISVPTPQMPSPNAFDSFVKAGAALMDEKAIGEATALAHTTVTYSLKDKQGYLHDNVSALAMLRQGFAYPYQEPPSRSFTHLFPHYAKFRGLARLLRLEGQVKSAQGNWGDAMNSYLDAMQMGEMIPRGGPMIGKLVGIACEAIGRVGTWQTIDHLTAPQARAAADRLLRLQESHFSYADTLQEEKWAILAGLQEIFRKTDWTKQLMTDMTGNGQNGEESGFSKDHLRVLALEFQIGFIGKKTVLKNFSRYMDGVIANARQPYAAHPPSPQEPSDPINQMILPVFSQGRFRDVQSCETQNALLYTALLLQAYRMEHGAYPKSLAELAPNYLKTVPNDPLTLQSPLRYTRKGNTYILYSIGPDGKDDGGKPIDNPNNSTNASNPNARYRVQEDSLGDIVAGKNTQ